MSEFLVLCINPDHDYQYEVMKLSATNAAEAVKAIRDLGPIVTWVVWVEDSASDSIDYSVTGVWGMDRKSPTGISSIVIQDLGQYVEGKFYGR